MAILEGIISGWTQGYVISKKDVFFVKIVQFFMSKTTIRSFLSYSTTTNTMCLRALQIVILYSTPQDSI